MVFRRCGLPSCFNTQPPEGGWTRAIPAHPLFASFNTQPPEGGWTKAHNPTIVQWLFQHTAARRRLAQIINLLQSLQGFNTQPPEGGWWKPIVPVPEYALFQHTAARRRLALLRLHGK